jgi:hypothetical protein
MGDITYPAWREWSGQRRVRQLLRRRSADHDAVRSDWQRGGAERPEADLAQALRKGHARVEAILAAQLPARRSTNDGATERG